jgi:hypothetical protein
VDSLFIISANKVDNITAVILRGFQYRRVFIVPPCVCSRAFS